MQRVTLKDTLTIKLFYKFGSITGILPSNYTTGESYWQILLNTVIVIATLTRFYNLFVNEGISKIDVLLVINFFDRSMHYILFILSFRSLLLNKNKWKEFFHAIENLNKDIGIAYTSKTMVLAKSLLWLIPFLAEGNYIFQRFTQFRMFQIVAMSLAIFQISATTAFVLETCLFISKRQHLICHRLKYFPQNLNKIEVEMQATFIERAIKNVYFLANTINSSFGSVFCALILLNFIKMFSILYITINISLDENISYNEDLKTTISNYMYLCIFFGVTIVLAVAGDKIEKAGMKITQICHILQVDLENPIIRTHFKKFAMFSRELRPELTVSGFLYINRSMVPLLISSLTSYAIILIQLTS